MKQLERSAAVAAAIVGTLGAGALSTFAFQRWYGTTRLPSLSSIGLGTADTLRTLVQQGPSAFSAISFPESLRYDIGTHDIRERGTGAILSKIDCGTDGP